jgi:hypothetical protein
MSSIILLLPFGLGDHIICHSIVREHCVKYERVTIFAEPRNIETVKFMYRDLKNLIIIAGNKSFAKNFILSHLAINAPATVTPRYEYLKIIGFQYFNPHSGVLFEQQEYQLAGLDLEKKWSGFKIDRDLIREQQLLKKSGIRGEYVFLHEDRSRNYIINRNLISKKFNFFVPKPQMTDNMFDYCTIIEKAKEIHVIDSSFMFLIDVLNYNNPEQKLYIHRYARPNIEWKLPILKKNWQIIDMGYSKLSQYLRNSIFSAKQTIHRVWNVCSC